MLKQQVKHGVHSGYAQQELYLMSRLMPYQPMRRPEKGVTQEDMWKTLTKHTRPDAKVRTETQSPKEKAPLEWKEPVWTSDRGNRGSGYQETACGRFTISRTEHELGYTYSAWDRSSKAENAPATLLGCKGSKEAAIALCEAAR